MVISDLKKGYQLRTNVVKDEKGDWITDSHNIFRQVEEPFLSAIECTWG